MFIDIPIKFSHLNVDIETDQDVLSKLNDSITDTGNHLLLKRVIDKTKTGR